MKTTSKRFKNNLQYIKKTIAIAAIINNSKQVPIMGKSKKKESVFLTMGCVTIVDAGRIINKHIKLNEWVHLRLVYQDFEDAGLFKMKTEIEKNKILIDLCNFMNYDIEIKPIDIHRNIIGVRVSKKETKVFSKTIKITLKIKHKK